jgi:hypothetical protein
VDPAFSQAIQEWKDFYSAVAGVAATLLGLSFVAVQLRPEIFHQREVVDIRDAAISAFLGFVYLLLIGLLFLVPHQNATGLGAALLALGILGLLWLLYFLRQALPLNPGPDPTRWSRRAYFAAATVTDLGLVGAGWGCLSARTEALYWLLAVDLALLLIALGTTWAISTHAQAS